MKNIVLFLDVDGVLNQYDNHERMKRYKISEKDGFSKETDEFNPYQKKMIIIKDLKTNEFNCGNFREKKLNILTVSK